MPAMIPSPMSAMCLQEQEEEKSNMYPVEQGWMVWRGQWQWQVSGSQTLLALMHSALSWVLLQTHLLTTLSLSPSRPLTHLQEGW